MLTPARCTPHASRFWFQNTDNPDPLTVEECEAIAGGESCNEPTQFVASTKLSAIIVRNTNATQTFPSFALPTAEPRAVGSFELEPNRVLRYDCRSGVHWIILALPCLTHSLLSGYQLVACQRHGIGVCAKLPKRRWLDRDCVWRQRQYVLKHP